MSLNARVLSGAKGDITSTAIIVHRNDTVMVNIVNRRQRGSTDATIKQLVFNQGHILALQAPSKHTRHGEPLWCVNSGLGEGIRDSGPGFWFWAVPGRLIGYGNHFELWSNPKCDFACRPNGVATRAHNMLRAAVSKQQQTRLVDDVSRNDEAGRRFLI